MSIQVFDVWNEYKKTIEFENITKILFYYNFTDPNGNKVSAILAQLRLVSVKRLRRKMYYLPIPEFLRINEAINGLINRNPAVKRGISEPEGAL